MARYRVRYVTHAADQLNQLPRSMQAAFDARVDDLKRDPYAAGDSAKCDGSYTTAFGGTGVILYTFSDQIDMVTILRVTWLEW
ncbi:MAG: type II toxin-antitoxin system RelE family toxin [Pseudonocardiaceae bacterium]